MAKTQYRFLVTVETDNSPSMWTLKSYIEKLLCSKLMHKKYKLDSPIVSVCECSRSERLAVELVAALREEAAIEVEGQIDEHSRSYDHNRSDPGYC